LAVQDKRKSLLEIQHKEQQVLALEYFDITPMVVAFMKAIKLVIGLNLQLHQKLITQELI
jgi:hypothetical protein